MESEWLDKQARFLRAQADADAGFDVALAELRSGSKSGHWIWYVFPQLDGLGRSDVAKAFAIADDEEAMRYVAHAVLGPRLQEALGAVYQHAGPLEELMDSRLDAMKLVSSMTLFGYTTQLQVYDDDRSCAQRAVDIATYCRELLKRAEGQGLRKCAYTLAAMPPTEPCKVCGGVPSLDQAVGSSLLPVSYARCLSCQLDNIEEEWVFRMAYNAASELGLPDTSRVRTIVDGKTLTWAEWLDRNGLPHLDF